MICSDFQYGKMFLTRTTINQSAGLRLNPNSLTIIIIIIMQFLLRVLSFCVRMTVEMGSDSGEGRHSPDFPLLNEDFQC